MCVCGVGVPSNAQGCMYVYGRNGLYVVFAFVDFSLSFSNSCPFLNHPPLLVLWWFLGVHLCRVDWRRIKHACARTMYRLSVAIIRYHIPGFGSVCKVGSQSVLPVLPAEITSSPDASANPDAYYCDDHDDKKNDPLVVIFKPEKKKKKA